MSVNQYAHNFGQGFNHNNNHNANNGGTALSIGLNNARRIVSNINIISEVLRDMN